MLNRHRGNYLRRERGILTELLRKHWVRWNWCCVTREKMCSPTNLIEAIHIQHSVLSPLRHNSKGTVFNPYCKSCVPLTAGGNMELYHVRKSPPSLAVDKEVAFLFNRGVILHLVGTREIVLKFWKENMKTMRKREASVETLVFLFHHVGLKCV